MITLKAKLTGFLPGTNIPVPQNMIEHEYHHKDELAATLHDLLVKYGYGFDTIIITNDGEGT